MYRYLVYVSLIAVSTLCLIVLLNRPPGDYATDETTLAEGKKLFRTQCISCHALEHDGVGPRLGGITDLLREKELMDFIRNPSRVIASGNERAVALHGRYKQTMPAYDWMEDEAIHSVLSYIHQQTRQYQIEGLTAVSSELTPDGLTGPIAAPVKRSSLKIELEEVVCIPRLPYSTPDLGIVTMRPHPTADGTLFVSDQGGVLYAVSDGKAEVFMDMRDHIKDFSIGPGLATGLGSFDFHPDFLDNGLIYISHAEKYNGQSADYRASDSIMAEVQWVLGEWKMDDPTSDSFQGTWRELIRLHAPTFGHGAQELAFVPGLSKQDPDYGLLYWGFGDGGSNNIGRPELGHHLRSFLGTILRIDPRGSNSRNGKYGLPPDNPFADDPDPAVMKEIWAYGFRNPHRMAWDHHHGNRMIATDIGEANIEEINIVEGGGDYGWPYREGIFGISTTRDMKSVYKLLSDDRDLFQSPFAQYDHTDGFAISGGCVYDGDLEILNDRYIFGDIVNGRLFYVNIDEALTDSTIYEIAIVQNGKETSLSEISNTKRLHLRIACDRFAKSLYVITKADGMIRRVTKAYRQER